MSSGACVVGGGVVGAGVVGVVGGWVVGAGVAGGGVVDAGAVDATVEASPTVSSSAGSGASPVHAATHNISVASTTGRRPPLRSTGGRGDALSIPSVFTV